MKYKELTTKSEIELRRELVLAQEKLHGLKLQTKAGQLKKTSDIAKLKKDIARLHFAITNR